MQIVRSDTPAAQELRNARAAAYVILLMAEERRAAGRGAPRARHGFWPDNNPAALPLEHQMRRVVSTWLGTPSGESGPRSAPTSGTPCWPITWRKTQRPSTDVSEPQQTQQRGDQRLRPCKSYAGNPHSSLRKATRHLARSGARSDTPARAAEVDGVLGGSPLTTGRRGSEQGLIEERDSWPIVCLHGECLHNSSCRPGKACKGMAL